MPARADDTIQVGFQAFWDSGGDKQVLGMVEALVLWINRFLKGAVKFDADNGIINKLKNIVVQMDSLAQKGVDAFAGWGKGIAKLEGQIDSLTGKYKQLDRAQDGTHKRGSQSFAEMLRQQLIWYSGLGLVVGALYEIRNALRKAFDFTQEIRNAGAIIGATSSELTAMQQAALEVGQTTTMSANEAAKALELLGQAGLSASQAIGALDTVAMLMTATGASAEEAVRGITTAMNVWNIEADQSVTIGNAMAAMLNSSKLEVKDLGVIFNYLASTAAQAGWSLEQVGAAAAVLANNGVRASTIGTSLSSMIGSLIAPTKKVKDAFAQFGVSIDDINPRAHALWQIIERIKASGMSTEAIFQSFNRREARVLVSLINAGAEELRNMEARLTGTNALLKTTAESMQGAGNQFKLLGNEIQNSFNRAMLNSEGVLAAIAKGLRALTTGAEDTFPAIAALNGFLLALSTSLTRAAGGTNLLMKVFGFFGGWIGAAAIAGTGLLSLLGYLHKSSERQLKDLEAQSNGYLVVIETVRQRNASLEDYTKKLDKNRNSQSELKDIRQQLIGQFPEIIRYLQQEGQGAGNNAEAYDQLRTAVESYRLAGLRDTKSATIGFFATTAKELATLRNQISETEAYFEGLYAYQAKTRNAAGISAEPLEQYQERIKQISIEREALLNKLGAEQDKYVSDSSNKIYNLLKSGMDTQELRKIIESLFSGEDLKVLLSRLEAFSKEVDQAGDKAGGALKLTEKKVKELSTNIGKDYDELVQKLKDDFEAISDAVRVSSKPEEERSKLLVDIERQRIKETLNLLEQEANEKEVLFLKSDADHETMIANINGIEAKLSKDRRKLYQEMYSEAKSQAQEVLSDIDKTAKMQQAGLEQQSRFQEDWFKRQTRLTDEYTKQTIEFYEKQARRMIQANEEVTRHKLKTLQEMHLSEKDFSEQSENILREFVDSQVKNYGDLRDKLLGVYDELQDKLKELKKEAADLAQNAGKGQREWAVVINKLTGKGGAQSFSDIDRQIEDLKKRMASALASGTKEGYEEAINISKEARDTLSTLNADDIAKMNHPELITAQIEKWGKAFSGMQADAEAGLQRINSDLQRTTQTAADSVKSRIQTIESQMTEARKILESGDIALKLNIDKADLKRQAGDIDIELKPRLDAEAAEKLKQIAGDTALTVEPKLDQAKVEEIRGELSKPTTNTHTVNPDTAEAQAAIAALKVPTESWHTIHVRQVYDGGGASTSDGSEAAPEGFATGGFLGGGYGGGDRIHILAELGEFINPKESVRYYGQEFFELLRRRAIPKTAIEALAPQRFSKGGSVELSSSSHSLGVYQVHFRVGEDEVGFPVEITSNSKKVFDQFLDRYQKEKLMRRRK